MKKFLLYYKNVFSGLSHQTWALCFVIMINRAIFIAIPFLSLFVLQYLHRQTSAVGSIFTVFSLGSITGSVTGGKLTDRIGFRKVQIAAIILGGLCLLAFPLVSSFFAFMLLIFVTGILTEAYRPANFTAISIYAAPGTETRSYSLNRVAVNVGWALGASLGGLVAVVGLPLVFVLVGGISILSGFFILISLKSIVTRKHVDITEHARLPAVKPWQNVSFLRFLTITAIFYTCFFIFFRVFALFLQQSWHLDGGITGIIMGLNGIYIAAFEMVIVDSIITQKPALNHIRTGVLLTGCSFIILLLPVTAHLLCATIFMTMFSFGQMLSLPYLDNYVSNIAGTGHDGLYASGYMLSSSIAQLIGPTAGLMIAQASGYDILWVIIAVLMAGCSFAYTSLLKNKKPLSAKRAATYV